MSFFITSSVHLNRMCLKGYFKQFLFTVVLMMAVTEVLSAQTNYYFGTAGTVTGAVWSTSPGGPFTSTLPASPVILNFNTTGTVTWATLPVATVVTAVNFNAAMTWTAGGTLGIGGTNLQITVATGITQDLVAQNFSIAAGAAVTKNGPGTLATANSIAYVGGFTLNAGTLVAGGVNAMGGGAGNTLTINGGTIAGSATRLFTNKFPGGIFINSDFQLGSTVAPALATANLTFDNTVNLGGVVRTITLGGTSGTNTLSGIISNGGLTVNSAASANILLLSGVNTYTGTTTINGGTVTLGNAAGLGTTAGGTTVASTGTLDLAGFSTVEPLTLSGGTVNSSAGATGAVTGNITLTAATTSTVNVANAIAFTTGVISGSGNLTTSGTNTLTLSGVNTYTGTTTIGGTSTVKLGNAAGLGDATGSTTVSTGATLDLAGFSMAEPLTLSGGTVTNSTGTASTESGNITLTAATTSTITGSAAANAITLSGIISGSGNITKTGANTVTFSGANTYTGTTTLSAGTLKAGIATNAFGNCSAIVFSAAATLDLNTFSQTVGSIASAANVGTIDNVAGAGTPTLTTGCDNTTTSFTGVLKNTTGTLSLTKEGTGTLTLGGTTANTYSGTTIINNGTIKLGAAAGLGGTGTGTTVNSNGILDLNGLTITEPLTLTNGTITNSNATTAVVNSVVTLTAATTNTINAANAITFTSGTLTGSGDVNKTGVGTLTLTPASAGFTGNMTINAGIVALGNVSSLGTTAGNTTINTGGTLQTAALSIAEPLVLNGGTLNSTGGTESGTISVTGNSFITGSGTLILSGVVSGSGDLTSSSAGTVTLSNANTGYNGNITVNAGTLKVGNAAALGSTTGSTTVGASGTLDLAGFNVCPEPLVINGTLSNSTGSATICAASLASGCSKVSLPASVTLDLTGGSCAIGSLTGSGPVTLGSNTLTIGCDNTSPAAYTGIISGTGAVTKVGTGTLTLSGVNTYTGTTTISAGTLKLGVAGAIADASAVTVNSPGILDLNNISETIGSLAGSGTVTSSVAGTPTLTVGGDNSNTTFSGVIQNGTSTGLILTKTGTGTMTVSGANTYTGLTTVSAGTLAYGANNALSTGSVTVSGGTLDMATFSDAVGTVTLVSGTIAGTTGVLTGTSYAVQSGTISAILGGAVALTKTTAGTVTMSGNNTYSGITTISAGVLSVGTIGNGGLASSLGAASNAAANLVLSGGTLQYTGATASTDRNYTLTAATASTIEVTTAGTNLTMSGASTATTGALTKTGAGTLTLSGANLATGLTTVSAGTLAYGVNNALATGPVTVSGGTLDIATFTDAVGAVTLTSGSITGTTGILTGTSYSVESGSISAILAGAVALTKSTAGTVTISSANTYTGATIINAGTLSLVGNERIANTSNVTFGGGTLTTNGTENVGTFNTTASTASTLALQTNSDVRFSGRGTSSGTLNVTGYTIGGNNHFYVGTTNLPVWTDLTDITFTISGTTYQACQISTGEIIPKSVISATDGSTSTIVGGSPVTFQQTGSVSGSWSATLNPAGVGTFNTTTATFTPSAATAGNVVIMFTPSGGGCAVTFTYYVGGTLYVNPSTGNDTNAGTSAAPKKTLYGAMMVLPAPYSKIIVQAGDYAYTTMVANKNRDLLVDASLSTVNSTGIGTSGALNGTIIEGEGCVSWHNNSDNGSGTPNTVMTITAANGFTLRNIKFYGWQGSNGSVIFTNCTKVTIENCTFHECNADAGALVLKGSSTDNTVSGTPSMSHIIKGCQFNSNRTATGLGGALFVTNSGTTHLPVGKTFTVDITNSAFSCNEAASGGAIYAAAVNNPDVHPSVTLDNCSFSRNKATTQGGAIFAKYADYKSLTNTGFCSNGDGSLSNTDGGAVYIDASASVNVDNCNFSGNTAGRYGATICVFTGSSSFTCTNSIFYSSVQGNSTAAVVYSVVNVVIDNCLFKSNASTMGTIIQGGGTITNQHVTSTSNGGTTITGTNVVDSHSQPAYVYIDPLGLAYTIYGDQVGYTGSFASMLDCPACNSTPAVCKAFGGGIPMTSSNTSKICPTLNADGTTAGGSITMTGVSGWTPSGCNTSSYRYYYLIVGSDNLIKKVILADADLDGTPDFAETPIVNTSIDLSGLVPGQFTVQGFYSSDGTAPTIGTTVAASVAAQSCAAASSGALSLDFCRFLSGNVFLDTDGDNNIYGTGTNAGNDLSVVLISSVTGKAVAVTDVLSDGTYQFSNVFPSDYTLQLVKKSYSTTVTFPTLDATSNPISYTGGTLGTAITTGLPSGYSTVGESKIFEDYNGNSALDASLFEDKDGNSVLNTLHTKDGTDDGKISITMAGYSIRNLDFGIKTPIISGTIYDDGNGLSNSLVDGAAINGTTTLGVQMYVNLVGGDGVVKGSAAVNADGTYKIPVTTGAGTYTIVLTTSATATGAALPSGWNNEGEAWGTNNGAGSGASDGTVSGSVTVTVGSLDVTGLNMGVNKAPVVGVASSVPQQTPSGTTSVAVEGLLTSGSAPIFSASDLETTVSNIVLTSFPTGATSFTVGGTTYYPNAAAIPGGCGSCVDFSSLSGGLSVATDASGIPTSLSVDPNFSELGDVVFPYSFTDGAGRISAGSATVPFGGSTLPVELLYFRGTSIPCNKAQLDWATASEHNNDFFIVERSIDGVIFEKIAQIDGNGTTSSKHTYTYTDREAPKVAYYRLVQTDFDGTNNPSFIVSVKSACAGNTAQVYPNPVKSELFIGLDLTERTTVKVEIRSALGQLVITNEFNGIKGNSVLTIPVESLPLGNYIVKVINESQEVIKSSIFIKNE